MLSIDTIIIIFDRFVISANDYVNKDNADKI